MSEIKSSLSASDSYKGFSVLSVFPVKDCDATAVYLRHQKTGLEVFHLLNNDEENLFAFAFRTPPEDSCGTPHIIEHSVFCGSERFPLKDPFVTLMNQSINTFMNAMTYPDRTVYPAASMVETDYFNLLSVYSDAVFFPKLDKKVFLQEGHRLEIDEDGKKSIQGVVYNEMKGSYSSFEAVSTEIAFRSLLKGTAYELDSGGDPLEIPSLTYEKYRKFYEKYYRPDNCLCFLYGNIPTEKQLDFLQQNLLDRLEKKFSAAAGTNGYPSVSSFIIGRETVRPFQNPIVIRTTGPASESSEQGAAVTINWLLGTSDNLEQRMECEILSELLVGHDGAPLAKALIDSSLGDDMSSNTGLLTEVRQMQFSAGLRNVKTEDVGKVEGLIFSVLEKLCKNGISRENIQTALTSVDFAIREIIRAGGPYSLQLMDRVLKGWLYGTSPEHMLDYDAAFENVKNRILTTPRYLESQLKSLLLDNRSRSLVVVTPDRRYSELRETKEKQRTDELAAAVNISGQRQLLDELHAFQLHKDTPEETACIPHIRPSDLNIKLDEIKTDSSVCPCADGGTVSVFTNTENTNGIVYIDVGFPADLLPPQDYSYLPFYTVAAVNMGWGTLDWSAAAEKIALCCGGFGASVYTASVPAWLASDSLPDFQGRDWVFFHVKMLADKTKEAFSVLSDCIVKTGFDDIKRLDDLSREYKNTIDSAVIPSGHVFALRRAARSINHTKAVTELWKGVSQLYTAHSLCTMEKSALADRLRKMDKTIKSSGAVLHVTTDAGTMAAVTSLLPDFLKETGIPALAAKKTGTDTNFFRQTCIPDEKSYDAERLQILDVPAQTGFSAQIAVSSAGTLKESAADIVTAHLLSNSTLWENIRTIGGAYGAFASSDEIEHLFAFATYRDPHPEKSLDSFSESLKQVSGQELSAEAVEKAVTGAYGNEIQPRSASARGYTGFLRNLYGITQRYREEKLAALLTVTADDIKASCDRILAAQQNSSAVIITGNGMKPENVAGKIIKLPL